MQQRGYRSPENVVEYLGEKITPKAVIILGHLSSAEMTSSFFAEHVSSDTKVATISGDFWHLKDQTQLNIAALLTVMALSPDLKKIFVSGCYGSTEANILGSCVEMAINEIKNSVGSIIPGFKVYQHNKTILI